MKRSIFTLLFCVLTSITGFAQVKKIVTDVNGNFEIVVRVGEDKSVTINEYGDVIDTEINGAISYYSSTGKIWKIGSTEFNYYSSTGKIWKVGSIEFNYYSSTGKIWKVGSTEFNYYSSTGKIWKIGSTEFNYYSSTGKLSSGNRSFTHNGISFRVTGGN